MSDPHWLHRIPAAVHVVGIEWPRRQGRIFVLIDVMPDRGAVLRAHVEVDPSDPVGPIRFATAVIHCMRRDGLEPTTIIDVADPEMRPFADILRGTIEFQRRFASTAVPIELAGPVAEHVG